MNSTGSLSGLSGPSMAGAGPLGSATTPGGAADKSRLHLHTYMYDYFLKNEQYELARLLCTSLPVRLKNTPKHSPDEKKMNGEPDGESADGSASKMPKDLQLPDVGGSGDEPFLFAWWSQFWDCFSAARNQGTIPAKQYLELVKQQRVNNERQRAMMNPQMQMNMRNQIMQNGGVMTNEMKKAAMQAGRPFTAQQARNQHAMMQQQQQQQQAGMHREGSVMVDMNGNGEGGSPMGDMIPSPKRQRLSDGTFGFAQAGPMGMGRGQPQGMPTPQMRMASQQAELHRRLMAQGIDLNNITEAQANALRANGQLPPGMPIGQSQGSPGGMEGGMRGANGQAGGKPGNSHALADYQMQLMLLEQQNKKRLLMARQESGENGQGTGPTPPFAAPMSPGGSRAGRSPSASEEQMKRTGTPQMSNVGMPPGDMPQNFSSPNGSFDAGQMPPGMNPTMYSQMAKMGGMLGPQGQQLPATSHPGFNGQVNGHFSAQQMEAMRQQQAAGRGNVNGNGMFAPMNQGGQPGSMTPQQRNAAMPPPPAPGQGEVSRTTPSSPQPFNAAPPTPSQTAKTTKKKEPAKKKTAKKTATVTAATATTPAATETGDAAQATTPAPPQTPNISTQTLNKGAAASTTSAATAGAAPSATGPTAASAPAAPQAPSMTSSMPSQTNDMNNPSFGGLDGGEYDAMNLNFNPVGDSDLLEQFDFDSFLNQDMSNEANGDNAFGFDVNMNYDDGAGATGGGGPLEAGATTDV